MIKRKPARTFESRKLTLEQRIARLEMIARSNRRRTMKNEGIDMSFRSEVERAVANELGDYYHVTAELDRGTLFVYVEDDEAAEGGEWGITGDFRIDEGPDGYVVSTTDRSGEPLHEEGVAADADEIASLISNCIYEYCQDL